MAIIKKVHATYTGDLTAFLSNGFYNESLGCRLKDEKTGAFTQPSIEELMRRDFTSAGGEDMYVLRRDDKGLYIEKIESTPKEFVEALDKAVKLRDQNSLSLLAQPLGGSSPSFKHLVARDALSRLEGAGLLRDAPQTQVEEFRLLYQHNIINQMGKVNVEQLSQDFQGILHFHFNVRGVGIETDLITARRISPSFVFAHEKVRSESQKNITGLYVLTPQGSEHTLDFPHGPAFDAFTDQLVKPAHVEFLNAPEGHMRMRIRDDHGLVSLKIHDPKTNSFQTSYPKSIRPEVTLTFDARAMRDKNFCIVNGEGRIQLIRPPP